MNDRMALQRKEFDAADEFAKQLSRHNATPIVDDDYPEVRHLYEGALASLIDAMKANGRFGQGSRYGLTATQRAEQACCIWSQCDESGDLFNTGCGHDYIVIDGETAGLKFCVYCGKSMRVELYRPEQDDETRAVQCGQELRP